MADANLLEALQNNTKLDDMVIYGNIRCAIEKPSFLSSKVVTTDGFFAIVDVLAFKCNGTDYFAEGAGYQDSKHIYFSKGSVVILCNDKTFIGKNVRVLGKTAKGCSIKKQRTKSNLDGITAFAWTRVGDNWGICPNKVVLLGDSDVKGTILEDYIVNLVSGQSFTQPKSTEGIMEYSGVSDVKPLELSSVSGSFEYVKEPIDLSTVDLHLTYRTECKQKSPVAEAIGEAIKELDGKAEISAKDACKSIIADMHDYEDENDEDSLNYLDANAHKIIKNFVNSIGGRYNLPLGGSGRAKGKDYVDELLDNIYSVRFRSDNDKEEPTKDEKPSKKLIDVDEIKRMTQLDPGVLYGDNLSIPIMKDPIKYATIIIGCVTGIGISSLVGNYNTAYAYNGLTLEQWFWTLLRNPYYCGLLGSDLDLCDCDKLYTGFSVDQNEKECKNIRSMLAMLETIKKASSRSTIIPKNHLMNTEDSYSALGKRNIAATATPFNSDDYMATVYVRGGNLNKMINTPFSVTTYLKKLNEMGMVEEIEGEGYMLARDIHKEFEVYSRLIDMGAKETGITPENVNDAIEEFESNAGFKLEKLQKDGIHLVEHRAGVLSGCAGSGKTTTSDCMVLGITKNLPSYELRFGAPTGKAARRLAEVVGGTVKTVHSMFGIGLTSEPYMRSKHAFRRKNDEGVNYAYFLDEMAMCNMNLMFQVVDHLNDDDLIYLLGDIKQLSPIGKGSPFKALMHFLPCVELGVSKRAAANGKINYNCGLINFASDNKLVELQEGEDFEIKPCADADIQREVVNSFRDALSSYEEDDVQVVTGYQTDKYPWSTTNLNPMLQGLLRNPEDLLFMYKDKKFYKNDRVIHVIRNSYEKRRYKYLGGNTYQEVPTFGVVNGELGKIVGYIRSDTVSFINFEEQDYSKEVLD